MSNLDILLKKTLQDVFGILFDVEEHFEDRNKTVRKYFIKPTGGENDFFDIIVTANSYIRLTIECVPSKHGMHFLRLINKSTKENRKIFSEYWKTLLNERHNSFQVTINEEDYTYQDFLQDTSEWTTFKLRFTKPGFVEDESEYESVIPKYLILICGMILSLTNSSIQIGHEEGSVKEEMVKKYERNPANRELCLFVKGYSCSVCGFNFEEHYGEIGKKYIEVHHIIPISEIGPNYILDPISDLVPLCSNCHSMIHRRNPPFSICELKQILK